LAPGLFEQLTKYWLYPGSTMVESFTHNPKNKGSNPSACERKWRKNCRDLILTGHRLPI